MRLFQAKTLCRGDKIQHSEKYFTNEEETMIKKLPFFALYDKFIREVRCGEKRKETFIYLLGQLQKFDGYMKKTNKRFDLDIGYNVG